MSDTMRIRLLRCFIILLLLWDILVTGYVLSIPYVEEYSNTGEKKELPEGSNISIEGETVIFGGNITAPKPDEVEDIGSESEDLFYGYSEEDIDLMAACVYFEAGNQSMEGKRLVADVILNRVASSRFPDTVVEVLSATGQFSTWKKIKVSSPEDIPIDCYGAVIAEISADEKYDASLGYTVYFFSSESWNSSVHLAKVGAHYFGGM